MRILHITDTHFSETCQIEEKIMSLSQTVQNTMQCFNIDLCIHTGDILNRNQTYEDYNFYYKHWPSCLHVPGNHDNLHFMKSLFPELSKGFPYIIEKKGIRIVGLDSSSGSLGKEQLYRLCQILSESKHCILLLHHQIAPLGESWLDQYVLNDHLELGNVLKKYKEHISAVFHGHFHNRYSYLLKDISIYSGASAMYQYSPWDTPKTVKSQNGEISFYEIGQDFKVRYMDSLLI